jgi:hypothetical protein
MRVNFSDKDHGYGCKLNIAWNMTKRASSQNIAKVTDTLQATIPNSTFFRALKISKKFL